MWQPSVPESRFDDDADDDERDDDDLVTSFRRASSVSRRQQATRRQPPLGTTPSLDSFVENERRVSEDEDFFS